jgi:sugar phosphate isomerase/epimerase
MKLAVRESMVPGASLEDKLTILESLDYDGIELHQASSLQRSALDLAGVFAGRRIRPTTIDGARSLLSPLPAERAASLAQLRDRLELCGALEAVAVLLVPIFGPPQLPDLSPCHGAIELEQELLLSSLKALAPVADRHHAVLMIEPLNRYETHLVNTLDQGAEYCRRVNRSGIRIMADFFHMNLEEADIAESIREAGPYIQYVHVADSNRKQPGRGHLDFRPGFRALKAIGYDSYLGVECGLIGTAEDALRETAAFLRKSWSEA